MHTGYVQPRSIIFIRQGKPEFLRIVIDSLYALQLQSNPTLITAEEHRIGLRGRKALGVLGRINSSALNVGIIVVATSANGTEYTGYEQDIRSASSWCFSRVAEEALKRKMEFQHTPNWITD